MIVRIGLPKTTGALPNAVFDLGAPALVSANSMWNHKRKSFRVPGHAIGDLDVALDSAGFVAMAHYGGYPWTVAKYVELAGMHSWAWWAQMDFCCEPEVASDRAQVMCRVFASAMLLAWCRAQASAYRLAGAFWIQDPMPVLQGWTTDDYVKSIGMVNDVLDGTWPRLVGLGSVCRRDTLAIIDIVHAVDAHLPRHVKLHLFGVKGGALSELRRHRRVFSTDSASWSYTARKEARARRVPCDIPLKIETMTAWWQRLAETTSWAQMRFPFTPTHPGDER